MIVVTGSRGFIGQAVTRALERRGRTVWGFDHPHDIRNRHALRDVLQEAEGVINLAGALGTTEIFGNERDAVSVNITGAINVFDAAAERDIPVVQIGTGHKGQPNPYAITKAAAEDMGHARAKFLGEKINIVRAYHVYGPGQKPMPPWGKGTVRKIVPDFACRALTGQTLELYGTGNQRIDLCYVDDVADVLVTAMEWPYGRVLEAGTGIPTTVKQAALDILDVAGSESRVTLLPMRTGEPLDAEVVSSFPACENPWPYRLAETIAYYREVLSGDHQHG